MHTLNNVGLILYCIPIRSIISFLNKILDPYWSYIVLTSNKAYSKIIYEQVS